VKVTHAYLLALDPTPAQERALRSHAGAARFAWNWGLGRCRDSFRLTGAVRCGRGTVTLPRLGAVKTHESTRKLARRLEDGTARILSATVSRTAQRWHVSFAVEVDRAVPQRHPRPGTAIGIDLGVKSLLTGADQAGTVITVPGPKPLSAGLRRLRRASRAHSRKKPGSAGRRKAAARLARLHARVADIRADALHKATSMLAARYETIVAEDLNVAGMTRNRRLARAVTDQGFGTARRMLAHKTGWHGGSLVRADRWYPSSKKCSGCGTVKAKLGLAERIYRCDGCGLVLDRDVNAARNLLSLAASGAERRNAGGGTVRPRAARHDPPNPEPGTPHGDKTGTATTTVAAA
jgi:putative transposase